MSLRGPFSKPDRRVPRLLFFELLPLLSRRAEAFYDPRTGELEPAFRVHMDQFRILRKDVSEILKRAEVLVPRVQEEMEKLR